ncbi:hypothetical protein [Vibrio fluvialis]|jgi:hypothetical protein|uniref:hypothetical protein n=1 Tax=Vibrio fluvialis TaxID=676 RepID=UPI001F4134C3|nr:hypothetical protein [Vibrio fluvialis]EKO3378385.1 hypothetical protein [Vibrio fluvialis]MCE7654700.1 hypothetical protein [Vibrio fluvialis]MCG6365341.1 hypothetical protein [Vibrio fluvialis]MDE5178247.1 hypothetical protein [Vibrio fluvialis]
MKLEIGKKYRAYQPACEIELDDGVVQFSEVEFTFTVLPKPKLVIAESIDIHGLSREVVKLPKHLAKPEWYAIQKANGKCSWFNSNGFELRELK